MFFLLPSPTVKSPEAHDVILAISGASGGKLLVKKEKTTPYTIAKLFILHLLLTVCLLNLLEILNENRQKPHSS